MRIRSSSMYSASALVSSPAFNSSSSSSSSSSQPSSHSSIFTVTSSENSTSSSPSNSSSPSLTNTMTRCEGLDLLVMAVHYLAGSIVGVPFARRRVIRRRKRALRFNNLIITGIFRKEEEERESKKEEEAGLNSKPKRQKREMALPSKYQDSVLQPWKRQSRRRQSIKIGDGSGSSGHLGCPRKKQLLGNIEVLRSQEN